MLVPTLPRTDRPPWVEAWEKARKADDWRLFVEQIPALAEALEWDPLNPPIPVAAFTDAEVWVQPGEYGYELCRYDFAAPVESNRICAMHPHLTTAQPLRRVLVGGLAFMLCLDCESAYRKRSEGAGASAASA